MTNISEIDNKLNNFFGKMYPDCNFFFTTSATSALELACHGLGLKPGDEVIMPTFNYVGVAQAFVKNGIKLVLIDSEPETMNIDLSLVENAITSKTKALLIMHYGGVACNIEKAQNICEKHKLFLIEDNAHGVFAKYKDNYLGSFGDVACISFENTKNISVGEGGILIVKKSISKHFNTFYNTGTDKFDFDNGSLDFYQWKTLGYKYYMSSILKEILLDRLSTYSNSEKFKKWNKVFKLLLRRNFPIELLKANEEKQHNAHLFWLRFNNKEIADSFISFAKISELNCLKHYYPMHLSCFAKNQKEVVNSKSISKADFYLSIVRIPFMEKNESEILSVFDSFFEQQKIC